jgi:hypothetical protein
MLLCAPAFIAAITYTNGVEQGIQACANKSVWGRRRRSPAINFVLIFLAKS